MTSPTLFVSGASGHLGRLVIAALQSRGYDGKIIAGTRDPSKLADLKGVEVRKADFTDKAGLVTALAGADKLLISGVRLFDRFAGERLGPGKISLAIEVTLQPTEKSLTDAEIEAVSAKVIAAAAKLGAVLRG